MASSNWRDGWTVDLNALTSAHVDGWLFGFKPVNGLPGERETQYKVECLAEPHPLTDLQIFEAEKVARIGIDLFICASLEL